MITIWLAQISIPNFDFWDQNCDL